MRARAQHEFVRNKVEEAIKGTSMPGRLEMTNTQATIHGVSWAHRWRPGHVASLLALDLDVAPVIKSLAAATTKPATAAGAGDADGAGGGDTLHNALQRLCCLLLVVPQPRLATPPCRHWMQQ